ncbi:MAG: hypothetical protein OXB86_00335, partial [Bdellovibrionales bacterium]|nr:hypothetical protein [Bdellovibrionales bacterium]
KCIKLETEKIWNYDQKDAFVQFQLGLYLMETGTGREAAMYWIRQAAEQGNTRSQSYLGYLSIEQGKTDVAIHWFRQAAEQNFIERFIRGDQDHLRDLTEREKTEEGRHWIRQAAIQGDIHAQHYLGDLLIKQGKIDEGMFWIRRIRQAAKQGDTHAQHHLGDLLIKQGKIDEGMYWLRQAAKQNNAVAQFYLGDLLIEQGKIDEALFWFSQAGNYNNSKLLFR